MKFIPVTLAVILSGQFASWGAAESVPNPLVKVASWSETWLDTDGKEQVREVTGEIWNEAFQAGLTKSNAMHIPARAEPYYLDAPLILKSGQSLTADPNAEIRLKPGTNTCMVRNENVRGFKDSAVPDGLTPDTNITIEGGIWNALANGVKGSNGNMRGLSDRKNAVHGTHGVILLFNVRHVQVKNVTIRQSKAFAVHLGIARDFVVDGVKLEQHERDGVHVHGPSSHGIIRNVSGDSHDDTVALNAWDWANSTASYGDIHHITVENITGAPAGIRSANAIRLLPGVKRFSDGSTLECAISDISIRNVTDIREFKFYDQPNLEMGRDRDFSVRLGRLTSIRLEKLVFNQPGSIQIATEAETIRIHDVDVNFDLQPNKKLVEIGPMSATYRHGDDPAKWVEIFSPDRDVTVKGIRLEKVRIKGKAVTDADADVRFVSVRDQKLNPDYPQTLPRGGTGKARRLP